MLEEKLIVEKEINHNPSLFPFSIFFLFFLFPLPLRPSERRRAQTPPSCGANRYSMYTN